MSVVRASGDKLTLLGSVTTAATARNVASTLKTRAVWTTFTDDKSPSQNPGRHLGRDPEIISLLVGRLQRHTARAHQLELRVLLEGVAQRFQHLLVDDGGIFELDGIKHRALRPFSVSRTRTSGCGLDASKSMNRCTIACCRSMTARYLS